MRQCEGENQNGSKCLQVRKLVGIVCFFQRPEDIQKQRKQSVGHLRHDLATNPSAVKFEEQYVACFPEIEEHKNHLVVGEVNYMV